MKFGSYLRENQLPEWRRAYINYRMLKKAIGRAELELEELDGNASNPQAANGGEQNDVERGERRQISGHAGSASPRDPPSASQGDERTADAVSSSQPSVHDRGLSQQSEISRKIRRRESTGSAFSTSSAGLLKRVQRRQSSRLTPANEMNPRKWRKPFTPDMSLDELHDACPDQSRRFFDLFDSELEKVTKFYEDREREMKQRFQVLSGQWQELVDHKKEFQAFRQRNPGFAGVAPLPGSYLVRRRIGAHGDGPDEINGREPSHNHMHGRPEEYTAARSKLKLATFEYYRGLGMLKSFRVMNRTGFTKALKKFEKATKIPCASAYSSKLDSCSFISSELLEGMIRDTEDSFASVFEHGDRKKALERLRDFGGVHKTYHFASWRSGLLIGLGIPLLIEGIVKSAQTSTHLIIPYWQPLLQLWGAFMIPVLFTMGFYLNILAWDAARINRVLIFELDVRTRLDSHQFIEIPALLFFLGSLLFCGTFYNFWPQEISPQGYAMAFLVIAMILLLMPIPILYPNARWWMARSFLRVITGGLVKVEFRDFLLGDELNSLYWSMTNFGLLYCAYNKGWPDNTGDVCSTNKMWATPVLAALPAIWRLGQSFRRYLDSDGLRIHLLNAGKYSASIVQFFCYYSWRIDGSGPGARKIVWIVSAIINACYTSVWDILMDWNVGQRGTKHFLLRNELGYSRTWLYYVAIVLNVILRFAWTIYLPDRPSVALRGFINALLEATRRIVWNMFRVESEHIGNVDGYRVTRNVPLPYTNLPSARATNGTTAGDDDDDDLKDLTAPQTTKQKLAAALTSLQDTLADDFAPLANIHLLVLGKRTEAHQATQRRKKARKERRGQNGKGRRTDDGDSSDGVEEGAEDRAQVDDDDDDDELGNHVLSANSASKKANGSPGTQPTMRMSPNEQVCSDDESDVDQTLAEMADAHRMMGKSGVDGGIGAALGREEQDKSKDV